MLNSIFSKIVLAISIILGINCFALWKVSPLQFIDLLFILYRDSPNAASTGHLLVRKDTVASQLH